MGYLLISVYLVLVLIYYQIYLKDRFLLNPAGIYIIAFSISAIGILRLLDFTIVDDIVHGSLLFLFFVSFAIGTLLCSANSKLSKRYIEKWWSTGTLHVRAKNRTIFLYVLASFCIFVSVIYYQKIGYNLFLEFIKGSASQLLSNNQDIAGLRLQAYAGDDYYAPGYVNQFKNTMLPLLSVYFVYRSHKFGNKMSLGVSIGIFFLSSVFVLGTGQRGAFFTVILIVALSHLAISRDDNVWTKALRLFRSPKVLFSCGIFFVVLAITSFSQGRFGSGSATIGGTVIGFVEHAFVRLGYINENAAVIAFDYLYSQPIEYGYQWLESLLGVLPGNYGSDLNSTIFKLMRGGVGRGNSPPSLIGSIYHNFGYGGVIFFPLLMGYIYHSIYVSLLKGRKTVSRLIFYSGLCVILGRWVYGGPLYVLNQGVVVIVFLIVYANRYLSGPNNLPVRPKQVRKTKYV